MGAACGSPPEACSESPEGDAPAVQDVNSEDEPRSPSGGDLFVPEGCVCMGHGVCPACRGTSLQQGERKNKKKNRRGVGDSIEVSRCGCTAFLNQQTEGHIVFLQLPQRCLCAPGGFHSAARRPVSTVSNLNKDQKAAISRLVERGLTNFQIQPMPEPMTPGEEQEFRDMLQHHAPETVVRRKMADAGYSRYQIEKFFDNQYEGGIRRWFGKSDAFELPAHWASVSLHQCTPLVSESVSLLRIPPVSSEFLTLQELLTSTNKGKRTRDREGKVPSGFTLVAAYRAENSAMLNQYLKRRSMVAQKCKELKGSFTPIKDVKTMLSSTTASWGSFLLSSASDSHQLPGTATMLSASAAESYLFHGTNLEVGRSICRNDFCVAFAAKSGMYGAGLYFAENSSKSDEYCEEEADESGEPLCTMLLCRVTMGQSLTDTHKDVDKDKLLRAFEAGGYDSVLGDRESVVGTYREFIVYHEAQAYCEYMLRYRRDWGS